MSIFQKLGLVKEEDEPVKSTVKQPVTRGPMPVTMGTVPTAVMASNTDYFKYFNDEMQKHAQPGLCYKDFAESLEALNGQPLTEQQKYTVVFTTFRTQGMTPDKLVQSALQYKGIMDNVKSTFDNEMQSSKKVGVEDKMSQVQTLEAEIQKLTMQIQSKTEQINKLNQEAADNATTLESENQAFLQAYNTKSSFIENHINNIKTFLNGSTTK
jgi:hypothetical protein